MALGFLEQALFQFWRQMQCKVFDFTLGTHPISTKGTTDLGGAKRRSALGLCLHQSSLVFQTGLFLREFFSIGFLSFQSDFLTGVDQPIDNGFADHRVFKQFEPTLGLDLRGDDERRLVVTLFEDVNEGSRLLVGRFAAS